MKTKRSALYGINTVLFFYNERFSKTRTLLHNAQHQTFIMCDHDTEVNVDVENAGPGNYSYDMIFQKDLPAEDGVIYENLKTVTKGSGFRGNGNKITYNG